MGGEAAKALLAYSFSQEAPAADQLAARLVQARVFSEVVDVTGIVLTKLDGTAKGGIVFQVQRELGVPVKLVGLGEGPDDLAPFEPAAFVVCPVCAARLVRAAAALSAWPPSPLRPCRSPSRSGRERTDASSRAPSTRRAGR